MLTHMCVCMYTYLHFHSTCGAQNYLHMMHLYTHCRMYTYIRMIRFFRSVILNILMVAGSPKNQQILNEKNCCSQDWAFAALMSIGLMELSHLATQEGR